MKTNEIIYCVLGFIGLFLTIFLFESTSLTLNDYFTLNFEMLFLNWMHTLATVLLIVYYTACFFASKHFLKFMQNI